MRESRAILFDLDDTLYPYGSFVRSGFRAIGQRLAEERGLSVASVLRALRQALANGERGRELQALCDRFALPATMVPALAALIRDHAPTLRLPRQSMRVLSTLRRSWKVGILTNGAPDIQRRKVAALGVGGFVDEVLFAVECSGGAGKPAPSAFFTALDRLQAMPETAVFVGDDPDADIAGASAVGMKTIHVVEHRHEDNDCELPRCGGVHARRLEQVPQIANRLLPLRFERHVF